MVLGDRHWRASAGKVVFVAPTRPLVHQQLEACCQRLCIPKTDVVELQAAQGDKRRALWEEKRVFFCTPQVSRRAAIMYAGLLQQFYLLATNSAPGSMRGTALPQHSQ